MFFFGGVSSDKTRTGWWFQRFCIFIPIWGRFPFWLICFKRVETTQQKTTPSSFFVSNISSPKKAQGNWPKNPSNFQGFLFKWFFLGFFLYKFEKKQNISHSKCLQKYLPKFPCTVSLKRRPKRQHSDNFEDTFSWATKRPWEAPHPYGARNLLWAPWWLSILFQEGFWNGEGPIFVASFDGRVDKKKSLSEALANVLAFWLS